MQIYLIFTLKKEKAYVILHKREGVVMEKYNILPEPKSIALNRGVFNLSDCKIYVADELDVRVKNAAEKLLSALCEKTGKPHNFTETNDKCNGIIAIDKAANLAPQGYKISVDNSSVKILGGDDAGCFYGIQTFLQMLEIKGNQLPAVSIEDAPDMQYRGFYYDATRGRVPSVEGAKKMVERLARYKINALQFYVEHTFDFKEFANENRTEDDRFTAQDILDIDSFCYDNFIDFEPSLSTFGHLYELLMKDEYKHLCELTDFEVKTHFWRERMMHHTIDASNPESIGLVCALIDQYLPLFRSEYFNICCDETFDLCKGRNAGKNSAELYISFVSKIIEHIQAAGKKVMMWGDIALQHPELLDRIPKDVVLLNWDYRAAPDINRIEKVKASGYNQIVCPGTDSWLTLIEKTDISVPNIIKMARGGCENGALGLLNTNWGDYGHACHPECSLFGAVLGACVSWNMETAADEEFENSISRSLYKSDKNIIAFIKQLATCHNTASWMACFNWVYDKENANFTATEEQILKSIDLAKDLSKTFTRIIGDEDILKCLKNAADGIVLLNEAALSVKLIGRVSASWKEMANLWFEEFKECWLMSSKPSEIGEIKSFLNRF